MDKEKEILFKKAQELSKKHKELKSAILQMVDELDKIELEYKKTIKKIKNETRSDTK